MMQNEAVTGTGLTEIELWIQLVIFVGILGGIVCLIGNSAMAIGIFRNKQLRSRFFIIMWFLVMSRVLTCIQNLIAFIHRTLRTVHIVPIEMHLKYCYIIHTFGYFSSSIEMVILLGLVIDRSLAIVSYNYYRTLTYKNAILWCCTASLITMMVKIIPSLIGTNWNSVVPCMNSISATLPFFINYTQNIDLAILAITLIIYLVLIFRLKYRVLPAALARSRIIQDNAPLIALKRQMRLLPLLRRLVIIHCGLSVLARVIISTGGFLPPHIGLRIMAYGGFLMMIDLLLNVIVMIAMNHELRQASFPCCTNSAISPLLPVTFAGPTSIAGNARLAAGSDLIRTSNDIGDGKNRRKRTEAQSKGPTCNLATTDL